MSHNASLCIFWKSTVSKSKQRLEQKQRDNQGEGQRIRIPHISRNIYYFSAKVILILLKGLPSKFHWSVTVKAHKFWHWHRNICLILNHVWIVFLSISLAVGQTAALTRQYCSQAFRPEQAFPYETAFITHIHQSAIYRETLNRRINLL